MTDLEIDNAILAVVEPRWLKVARVIIDAAEKLGDALPAGDTGHSLVGRRVEVLVGEGRLVSQGDINKWRHSEVRLP